MNADMALANGVDAMLSTFEGGPNQVSDKAAASNVQYMRTAMHNILYTTANSWAYDGSGQDGIEGWKMAFYVADAVIAAVVIGGVVLALRKRRAVV